MMSRKFQIVVLCCVWLFSSGCATVLTLSFPKVKETRKGETVVGNPVSYHYSLTETKDALVLLRQPVCSQKTEVIHVERKQLHGVIAAIVEIPFFGLGLADLVVAGTLARSSVTEIPGGYVKIGDLAVCGDFTPAPYEELIIEFPESLSVSRLKTDAQGRILLSAVHNLPKKDTQYIVFVKEKDGVAYVKTLERSHIYP